MKRFIYLYIVLIISIFLIGCDSISGPVDIRINFDSNGGSAVESIETLGNSRITMPESPTKEGFVFGGWYWDNDTFDEPFTANSLLDAPISSNITVYAKWNEENEQPIGTIRVLFNSMSGSKVDTQYIVKGNTVSIPEVSREGYTLDGWYTSLNNGETYDEKWSFTSNTVNNDITLYAKWIIIQYTISFNSSGGSAIDSITQDYNTQ